MRQDGLESEGEFSAKNIAFKVLRRNGQLAKLINDRQAAKTAALSTPEDRGNGQRN
jgi:hypothetical protein